MLESISYFLIFGKPAIFWGGLTTYFCLLMTIYLGRAARRGKLESGFKWHFRFAYTTAIVATIHGGLGILAYTG
ncbi:hypothetical protein HN604_01795 [archaeon]|jgi:hypothetical protein|nr:hypothetical protein [archaeon]MBT6182742.1 hypothetical protein [archaeon]MBT6606549.1 hypothetical protein [archaeon]MBT7251824.1 hypothetical protein [archaeon]MBT7660794.1 hypothetical protein [archaeon]